MSGTISIGDGRLRLRQAMDFTFARGGLAGAAIELSPECLMRVQASRRELEALLERKIPIYGVSTGFGDSCHRVIQSRQSEALQHHLVSYLLCGTGAELPSEAVRATLLIRLRSLSRGYSGVSPELLQRMKTYLERDWIPVVPREGSLGASGDLIPLAYLARAIEGEGKIRVGGAVRETSEVLRQAGMPPYTLKPKEGLALVNGTSAMAGLCLLNLNSARYLVELGALCSAWLCLALRGRTEAFGTLVNERAKEHPGQARAARMIRSLIEAEGYRPRAFTEIATVASREGRITEELVQDRYSLRCVPQVLGPVLETLDQLGGWLETELNGTSDNPLIDPEGELATGGNFYGGYLGQGMDYLKLCIASLADLMDRQLMILIDDKTNRGLPANLANWPGLPEEERFLHHGLKGLHQAVNAVTSEILAKAMPNTIFSRSSESHNQDKVSLGMSAAVQCHEQLEQLFSIQSMYLICLAQGLDLRGAAPRGGVSRAVYDSIRRHVPFVERDRALDGAIQALREELRTGAARRGTIFEGELAE